jgi:hypothetical protein
MWSEYDFAAVRCAEFKGHIKILTLGRPMGGLSEVTVNDVGMSPWVYNLYSDPKEQFSVSCDYLEWVLPILTREGLRHQLTFLKYPPKNIGLAKTAARTTQD